MTKGLTNRFKPAWKKAGKPQPPKLQGNKGRPYGPSRTPKTKG